MKTRLLSNDECTRIASLPNAFHPSHIGGGSQVKLDMGARRAETATLFQARWKDALLRNASLRILELMPLVAVVRESSPPDERHILDERHLEFAQFSRYAAGGQYGWHTDRSLAACNGTTIIGR